MSALLDERRRAPEAARGQRVAARPGQEHRSGFELLARHRPGARDARPEAGDRRRSPAGTAAADLTLFGKFEGGLDARGRHGRRRRSQDRDRATRRRARHAEGQAEGNPEIQKVAGAKAVIDSISIKAAGKRVTLTIGGSGGAGLGGVIAALAMPSLMRTQAMLEGAGASAPPTDVATPEPQAEAPVVQEAPPEAAPTPRPAPGPRRGQRRVRRRASRKRPRRPRRRPPHPRRAGRCASAATSRSRRRSRTSTRSIPKPPSARGPRGS